MSSKPCCEVQSCCRFGQTWSTNVGRRNWAEQFFCVCQIITRVAILVAGGFQNEKKPNHEMQVACISRLLFHLNFCQVFECDDGQIIAFGNITFRVKEPRYLDEANDDLKGVGYLDAEILSGRFQRKAFICIP